MNITLKSIKHLESASEETNCFTATVYVDGKRAFGVKNAGHGGGDEYYMVDKKSYQEMNAMIADINTELAKTKLTGRYASLTNDLEIVVGDIMENWLVDKDIKKSLKKVCYLRDGSVWCSKLAPTQDNIERIQAATFWKPEYKILNDMPIEEIRQYF